jgi:hypothetical protein
MKKIFVILSVAIIFFSCNQSDKAKTKYVFNNTAYKINDGADTVAKDLKHFADTAKVKLDKFGDTASARLKRAGDTISTKFKKEKKDILN